MRCAIVIPVLNPSDTLLHLVSDLLRLSPDLQIIVVDDGSTVSSQAVFAQLLQSDHVNLVRHAANLGKGQALKTGFNYVLTHFPAAQRLVTADGDGQHKVEDILKLVQASEESSSPLVLGVRDFSSKAVPIRSWIGNRLMCGLFFLLSGVNLRDTQTGLRAMSLELARQLLQLTATRYEYEMDVLIWCKKHNIAVHEVAIETIYINGNKSSHFNPFFDSFKISFTMLRFAISSLLTSFIDMAAFMAAFYMFHNILLSIVIGRCVAIVFNFTVNKVAVFKHKGSLPVVMMKYLSLVVIMTAVSYTLIQILVQRQVVSVFWAKILAESALFVVSFSLQRLFVFRTERIMIS